MRTECPKPHPNGAVIVKLKINKMRILKDTEWSNPISYVGYDVITKVENTDEVEVTVRGYCDENGWISQEIKEVGSDEVIYRNGYFLQDGGESIHVSKFIPEIDQLLEHLDGII